VVPLKGRGVNLMTWRELMIAPNRRRVMGLGNSQPRFEMECNGFIMNNNCR